MRQHRLVGAALRRVLSKYLPGQPTTISQNIPASRGITALNYLTQQAKPDGTTLSLSSSSQVDPITYRAPLAKYDPANFGIIGAVGAGDTAMIIHTDTLPQLWDMRR